MAKYSGASAPAFPTQNTNRWNTKQLVTMALMCAIAALLSFVQIPLIPAMPVLEYDPSLVPAAICGLAFGPGAGIAVGALAAVIHGLMLGNWVGSLMNIIATICFVTPTALVYARMRSFKGAALGLALGAICAIIGALISNLTIGVVFWYGSLDAILPFLLPAVVPFNIIKGVLNTVLALVVWRAISHFILPQE